MPKRRKVKTEAEQEAERQRFRRLFREDSSLTNTGHRLYNEVHVAMSEIIGRYIGEYPTYEIEAVIHKVNFNPIFNIICRNAKKF